MSVSLRFMDWPLRAKMAALLALASLLPLATAAFLDLREQRQRFLDTTVALLAARGDELQGKIDSFHRGYRGAADRLARLPDVVAFSGARSADAHRLRPALGAILAVETVGNPDVRGVGILDAAGTVQFATEARLVGTNVALRRHVRRALAGEPVISDVFMAGPEVDDAPTIAYLAPVRGTNGRQTGVAALWIKAGALWNIARASNELAGPRSFAVLFDQLGVRIAHTYSDDIVFHPGGPLDAATVDALVAERRFGSRTRELLADVRAFPEQFDRARAAAPDPGVFYGYAPVNQTWNYGVGRRFQTVPWTLFYMIPAAALEAPLAALTRQKALFAGAIMLVALVAGALLAAVIVRPIRALSRATAALAAGNLGARVAAGPADEIGRLSAGFNTMAERLDAQATALRAARDELEVRVQQRTAELVDTTRSLELEIVERKRAEEALRESEQSLATTLHSIGDAVIATDLEGRVVRMNPVAEQLTGWTLAEARLRPLTQVFRVLSEDTRQAVEDPVAHVLRQGQVVGLANHTLLIARDGTERPIADSGAPIHDPHGTVSGVVLVFRDQTEARRMEEVRLASVRIEAQNERIQEASRLKSEFLANMSHELRTPLNGIIGFAELMHDGKVGPVSAQHAEYLGDILVSAGHLLQLINDVLDLSKVEAGKMQFHPEPVDIGRLLGEVRDGLRPLASGKRIAVELAVDPALTGVVVDPAKLKQVVFNYLSNALKFTPEGGRVRMAATAEDAGWFRLEVTDSGPGIKPEDMDKLFVEFQQLDAGAGKRFAGTGLGLALTKRLVEAQGGAVGVRAAIGQGSVFFARLPRVP